MHILPFCKRKNTSESIFGVIIFFALAIILLYSQNCQAEEANSQKEIVKIGVIAPLTGGLAQRGDDITRLLKILEPQLNSQSKKYTYKFILDDGKCGAGNTATTIANKFISFDNIKFLITACSGETLQAGPLAQRAQVLTFAVLSNHPDVKNLGDYVFRTYLDIKLALNTLADYLKNNIDGKVAILTEENAFTLGTKIILQQNLGDKIGLVEDFPADTGDFYPLLLKTKNSGVTAVYFNVMSEGTLAKLVKQAKTINLNLQMFSYAMPETSSFLQAAGKAGSGLLFIGSPDSSIASDEYKSTYSKYMSQYPEGPSFELLLRSTFDAVVSMYDAIEAVGPDSTKAKDFLYSYKARGALGTIEFDDSGDIKDLNFTLKQIMDDGSIKIIKTW